MEKFDKTNPYNPNAKKSIKINLGKPKLPKWAKIILISFVSIIGLAFIGVIITLANETPQEKIAREERSKEQEKQEQIQNQKEAEEEKIKNLPKYDKMDALAHVHVFIKDQLKSPSSAEFGGGTDGVIQTNDTTFTVIGTVDSQNSFGAMLRSNYSCKVIFHPKDNTQDFENFIMQ